MRSATQLVAKTGCMTVKRDHQQLKARGGDSMPTIDPKSVIDTSKMSPAQREALELTESAREAAQAELGFAGGLFIGRFIFRRFIRFPLKASKTAITATRFSSASKHI